MKDREANLKCREGVSPLDLHFVLHSTSLIELAGPSLNIPTQFLMYFLAHLANFPAQLRKKDERSSLIIITDQRR